MKSVSSTEKIILPAVGAIVAVASGKGGVGKSTLTALLAHGMAQKGVRVGVVDADIYGPSQKCLLRPEEALQHNDKKQFIPPLAQGIPLMSMAYFVKESEPIIWRGPMVQTAVQQLFKDVAWPPLDLLLVDLPPGTGDAHLTLAQKVPLAGAVVVSTPQDLALIDARKALSMFERLQVPLWGLVENMSGHTCEACGHHSTPFHASTVAQEAAVRGVPYWGHLPLTISLRQACDAADLASFVASFPAIQTILEHLMNCLESHQKASTLEA